MLIDFFLHLRSAKLPVSIKEYLTLLEGLKQHVVGTSVDDIQWSAVLKSVSGFEMYRKKYGRLVPNNIVGAMSAGDMLAVMVFSLFLGAGIALTRTDAARRFEEALTGLYDVVMRLLDLVIGMAPLGVACLLFTTTARLGYDVLGQLAAYVGVVDEHPCRHRVERREEGPRPV